MISIPFPILRNNNDHEFTPATSLKIYILETIVFFFFTKLIRLPCKNKSKLFMKIWFFIILEILFFTKLFKHDRNVTQYKNV